MKKYYTRACNFFYGLNSKKLIKNPDVNKIYYNKEIENYYEVLPDRFLQEPLELRDPVLEDYENEFIMSPEEPFCYNIQEGPLLGT